MPPTVSERVQFLLSNAPGVQLKSVVYEDMHGNAREMLPNPDGYTHVLTCGNSSIALEFMPWLPAAGPEAFGVQTGYYGSNQWVVAANGNPDSLGDEFAIGRGAVYGCYAALEQIGFAFLQPLSLTWPTQVDFTAAYNTSSSPQWPVRGWHIHTQHPLELTDLLTGFAIYINGTETESWESMLWGWSSFLEWAVASHLNEVEWLLLWAKDWEAYALSPERQARFTILTEMCHNWTIRAGADCAVAEQQQHAFALINSSISDAENIASIYYRINWVFDAGFDFLSTENGFSEFTHPSCEKMLQWINVSTEATTARGKKAWIKVGMCTVIVVIVRSHRLQVHCSSGQVCTDYLDPYTGQPLNFNYLVG